MIHEATRTLVKSHPEVWEQCSDPESLSRHLNGSFGEIRITRLEPESTVAWEGEHGSGTVTIEPSAWGTRVTLTARTELDQPSVDGEPVGDMEPEPEPPPDPEPAADDEPAADVDATADAEPAADADAADLAEAEPECEPPPPASEPAPDTSRDRLSRLLMRVWRGRAAPDGAAAGPESATARPEPEPPEARPPEARQPEPRPPEPAPPEARQPEPEPPEARQPEPPAPRPPDPVSPPDQQDSFDAEAILMAALESMGQAHHRPYSRG